ncbi:KR-domain-containing protein [Corynespora cassiicola Philippines]|uniref:KR-domain-containing protein n=1 Tax=Corynespora cassiicola Philippines TaxID=1448308 RepID=A0A2T2N632_CORCC|nr:KR-domain-containing protein [Corynespora cassiicola Philippines]
MPVVFGTAVYALFHLAQLEKNEKVLIQSAAGGLGLAVIQVAQSVGADIYVTMGTQTKMNYLAEYCGIDRSHVFSSRPASSTSAMMQATGSKRFDVMVSSSNGTIMQETARCLSNRGIFIHVGRVDVQSYTALAMNIFERNATFSSFDFAKIVEEELRLQAGKFGKFVSNLCVNETRLFKEVDGLLNRGIVSPSSSIKAFDIAELDQALLYFSKGTHIGKIAGSFEKERSLVPMLNIPPSVRFDGHAIYVIVGDLGGLGRSIIQWMVEHGARNFVIFNRSGTPPKEALILIDELTQQGVSIHIHKCDVVDKSSVYDTIRVASKDGPIKGIMHAAVVLEDRLFRNLLYSQ